MWINACSVVDGSQKKSMPSFQSRVTKVITPNGGDLSANLKEFIDVFEASNPKNSYGIRMFISGFIRNGFSWVQTLSGMSGQVHVIKNNYNDPALTDKFIIKEHNPLKYSTRFRYDLGGIGHEYDRTVDANKISPGNTPEPIAYVETEEGGKYMLTSYIADMEKVGGHTSNDAQCVPITENYLRGVISTLLKFDKQGFYNPDLNRGNVQQNKYNKEPRFIDFQWATNYPSVRDKLFAFYFCEAKSNIAFFEANVIADYGIALLNNGESTQKVRDNLKNYLRIRAEYADTISNISDMWSEGFEQVKKEVYKNPSDNVIDAELLRLSILRNHRLQFLYTDPNVEKPRNMMKLITYSALAKHSADKLVEFASIVAPKNYSEKKYFEYIKNYGEFWQNNADRWYPETVDYLKKVASREEYAPGIFFEEEFNPTKPEKYLLTMALTDSTKNKIDISDDNMYDLYEQIFRLERFIMKFHSGKFDSATLDKYNTQVKKLFYKNN